MIVERCRQRYGRYPARILADELYRNRQTMAFCKEHGINITGPALGRPTKNTEISMQEKSSNTWIYVTATRWKVLSEPVKRLMG